MSNILTIATSPIRGAVTWLREEWHEDKIMFWLLLSGFVLLAFMVILFVFACVGFVLALTGVIPMGHGGGSGTSHYIPHPIIVPHIHVG